MIIHMIHTAIVFRASKVAGNELGVALVRAGGGWSLDDFMILPSFVSNSIKREGCWKG